jgi:hypothetical protein
MGTLTTWWHRHPAAAVNRVQKSLDRTVHESLHPALREWEAGWGGSELPDRIVAQVPGVEVAARVEGQAARDVQPRGRAVAQVYAGRGE